MSGSLFFIGMFLGVTVGAAAMWFVQKNYYSKWYDWVLGVLAVLMGILAFQHLAGSFNEFEPTAAWAGFAMYGVIGLIFAAVNWQLIARRGRA
jgi:hypothetical protein